MTEAPVSLYETLTTFTLAAIALLASPGPATLALAASGAAYGMKRSLHFFAGIMSGLVIVVVLVATGLYWLLHRFPVLTAILTLISVVYIFWLAYCIGTASPIKNEQAIVAPGWWSGFVLSITNIKAYAAFAALQSSFSLGTTSVLEPATKALIILLVCVIFDFLWVLLGSRMRTLFVHPTWSRRLNVSFAVLMIVTVAWSLALVDGATV